MNDRRKRLRELVNRKQGLVVPGAYDGVSARLIEAAGFEAVYMTGFGTSASRLGLADLGFAGLAEMADHARNLAYSVSVPLIADADTGYGNALNARRTVSLYESAGVAALHIEDQALPKRCGHLDGKTVVPLEEFAQKIRAAVEARADPDLMVIARTDAVAVTGFDDAMRRAEAAAEAGADMLFIEATSEEQTVTAMRAFDLPMLYNLSPGLHTPPPSIEVLRQMGYAVIILPTQLLLTAATAMRAFVTDLRAGGDPRELIQPSMSFSAFGEVIGLQEQMALGAHYGG